MSLASFLEGLHEDGRVLVASIGDLSDQEREEGAQVLRGFDETARLELSSRAPELSPPSALWAACLFYRACQFLVFREIEAKAIEAFEKAVLKAFELNVYTGWTKKAYARLTQFKPDIYPPLRGKILVEAHVSQPILLKKAVAQRKEGKP